MLEQPAMGGAPNVWFGVLQPLAEPLAHQRMGVEHVGRRRVRRRQQPHIAQARSRALPCALIKIDDRVGEPRDPGLFP